MFKFPVFPYLPDTAYPKPACLYKAPARIVIRNTNKDAQHFPAWVTFNKRVKNNSDAGVWHETYKVAAGKLSSAKGNYVHAKQRI
jgi:hypothetical protein